MPFLFSLKVPFLCSAHTLLSTALSVLAVAIVCVSFYETETTVVTGTPLPDFLSLFPIIFSLHLFLSDVQYFFTFIVSSPHWNVSPVKTWFLSLFFTVLSLASRTDKQQEQCLPHRYSVYSVSSSLMNELIRLRTN